MIALRAMSAPSLDSRDKLQNEWIIKKLYKELGPLQCINILSDMICRSK